MKHDPRLNDLQTNGAGRGNGGGAGHVALIGCGPGDPDLLTVKALRLIQRADVLVSDRLVDPAILDEAHPDAERIFAGKTPGGQSTRQEDINAILVREARKGKRVARLKGGDPLIFGRAVEELAALQAAGIDHEVVPGVTAAHACAASLSLPPTSRAQYRLFSVLTGTTAQGEVDHDWRALARAGEPFAIYMGVRNAPSIQDKLVAAGFAPCTPVVIVESGTLPREQAFATTLDLLAACLDSQGLKGPAVIFIGLDWADMGLAMPEHVRRFDGETVTSFKRHGTPAQAPADMPLWIEG